MRKNIEAMVLLGSVNPAGQKITTFLLKYPRFIHAEFMTHRLVSRNAASSRAVPVEKMIEEVRTSGAHPEFWGKNQSGMQSSKALEGEELAGVRQAWSDGSRSAAFCAERMVKFNAHKQIANRLLEPFVPYSVLATATQWDNFFALRAHPDAQPEMQVLAYRMLDAYLKYEHQKLGWDEWHIPFGDKMPEDLSLVDRIQVAIARAARLSYLTFDGEMNVEKDLQLYEKLIVSEPLHASPAEHVAVARPCLALKNGSVFPAYEIEPSSAWGPSEWGRDGVVLLPYDINYVHQGNFLGWTQHRKMQKNECVHEADLHAILANKPDWISL